MFYAWPLIKWRLRLEEHGTKIVFIKGIRNTIADQSHGLGMTPELIKQLRATLRQKSIRTKKSSQRQNWKAVSNTMVQTNIDTGEHEDFNVVFTNTERKMEHTL